MKYIPWKEVGSFRVGDIIDFDGTLAMLTECFDFRAGESKYGPNWAWRAKPLNIYKGWGVCRNYSGDTYGIAAVNLYNIYKSKVVAKGPEK